jgi:hypothetical protein
MRISVFLGAAALTAICASAPLQAAETIAYSYDAQGRLIKVQRTGTVNNGITTVHEFDKADNRVSLWNGTGSPPGLSFAIGDAVATEGGILYFYVTKTGTTSQTCSVQYATGNGGAVAPGDYGSASATLYMTSSQTSSDLTVYAVPDGNAEVAETMTMTISSPSCGATITRATATGTINDP